MSERNERRRNRHAFATFSGYEVPLIGIPAEATTEKCDQCGGQFDLVKMTLRSSGVVCKDCARKLDAI